METLTEHRLRRSAVVAWVGLTLLVPISACSSSGDSPESPASPSSNAVSTETAASAQRASYDRAIGEVNAWLALWAREGSAAAAAKYLSGDELPASGVPGSAGPDLVSGVVQSYQPSTWTSQDSFVLTVTMELHFRSGAVEGNWNGGANTRFFRFEKATGSVPYRMYVTTGP